MSFDKFSIVCVEYNLFSDEQQNKYINIKNKSDIDHLWREMKKIWPARKLIILERFLGLKIITKEEIDKWVENVEVLDSKIYDEKIKDYKPFLIAYNILEKESDAFEEAQIEMEFEEEDYEENLDLSKNLKDNSKEEYKSPLPKFRKVKIIRKKLITNNY